MDQVSFDDIFTTYYQSPSPARAVAALQTEAGRDPGWLDKGSRTLQIYFFSAIATEYPPIVRDYEALFDRQPTRLVLDVLAQSGDEETRRFVSARLGDERFHAFRDQMRAFVKGRPVGAIDPLVLGRIDPLAKPARTALDLDLLWAEFFVTGNTVPVERIIDVLDWPDVVRGRIERGLRLPSVARLLGVFLRPEWQPSVPTRVIRRLGIDIDPERRSVVTPEDLDLLCAPQQTSLGGQADAWSLISPYISDTKRRTAATKGAASWSLGSNAIDHPPVLETCEARLATRSDRARLALLAISAIARFSRGESRQAAAWAERYLELSPDNVEIRALLERATRAIPSPPSEEAP